MLFNSKIFIIFFLVVYLLYLFFRKHRTIQNLLLLIASYVFYGYWDWRFLFLLFISTIIDFTTGFYLYKATNPLKRKFLLLLSIFANLGLLGFFKYFNFFASSFTVLLNSFGLQADTITLNIILPVGISFYTFQTMSYTIDIYRRELKPVKSLLDFALFVSFFPQLVAGPIERATNLLPQISKPRAINKDQIWAGLFLILWGYYKKLVIADQLSIIANTIFNNYHSYTGIDLLIGVIAFAFQIYGDFSGYSDIARGVCKIMGFDLMINFRLPYFSKNPSEFWKRWHISLSTWLRDYLYIPLGGNRKGEVRTYINLLLTMLLGGLWHGAAWNFVFWGFYHGLLLALHRFVATHIKILKENVITDLVKICFMFFLTLIGWLLFRARTVEQIMYFVSNVGIQLSEQSVYFGFKLIYFILPLFVMQIFQALKNNMLFVLEIKNYLKIPVISLFIIIIMIFGVRQPFEFIYFQF